MPNPQPPSVHLLRWPKWLAIAILVGAWAAGTLYLDYVLYPYVQDFDADALWSLMLAAPFNAALLWMLVAIVMSLRSKKAYVAMPDIVESGDQVRIKLHPGPVTATIVAFIAATIGGVMVSTFCMCAGAAAVATMVLAWLAVLILTVLSYFRVIRMTATGQYDITLNLAHKTMTVPPALTSSEPHAIPFMDIVSVHVNEITNREVPVTYQAVLHWRGSTGDLHKVILKETIDKSEAEALVACILADVARHRQTGTHTLRGQD